MLILMASVFISGIIFFIFMILNTKSYDYLLNVRYTVFGTSEFYKDSWTYRIILAIFGLIISFFSIILVLVGMIIIGTSIREIPN